MSAQEKADPVRESERLDIACDQAIAACDGDLRRTIHALILANEFLEAESMHNRMEIEKWRQQPECSYVRFRRSWTAEEIERWGQDALDRADRLYE